MAPQSWVGCVQRPKEPFRTYCHSREATGRGLAQCQLVHARAVRIPTQLRRAIWSPRDPVGCACLGLRWHGTSSPRTLGVLRAWSHTGNRDDGARNTRGRSIRLGSGETRDRASQEACDRAGGISDHEHAASAAERLQEQCPCLQSPPSFATGLLDPLHLSSAWTFGISYRDRRKRTSRDVMDTITRDLSTSHGPSRHRTGRSGHRKFSYCCGLPCACSGLAPFLPIDGTDVAVPRSICGGDK